VEEKYRDMELYAGETLTLVMKRWEKLEKDFYSKKKERFDIRYRASTMTLCMGVGAPWARATHAKSGQYVNANKCSTRLCSKIPDIYDCIKFDCIHNWSQLFFELEGMPGMALATSVHVARMWLAWIAIPCIGRN
jgi:hypothetical protein